MTRQIDLSFETGSSLGRLRTFCRDMKVQTENCCRVLGEYEVELLRSMVVRLRTEVSVDMAPSDERHVVVLKPAGALVDDMGSEDVEKRNRG